MAPAAAAGTTSGGTFPPEIEPHVYRGKWWKHSGIRTINLLLVICLITSSTNGYDGSMMNGLQVLDNWKAQFNNPQGSTKGLLNAVQNIGAIIGLPFSPYITDGLGRRAGIMLGSIIMLAGVAMQASSNHIGVFIASRGLIGFGLTFAQNAAPILITELAYPTQRAGLTSCFNSLWYSGSIIAAWTTFGTFRINNSWSWRIPSILQAIPSIVQVFLIFLVPESPRWLCSKGRHDEARRTLARYHTDTNDLDNPLVEFEMNEIQNSLELEKTTNTSWKSLVATKGNRKRLRIILGIAFFSQWSGNGLVSYYLTNVLEGVGITSQDIQALYNGILQLFNFAVAVGAAFLVDRIGRRTLFITSTTGMFVTWIFWTACEGVVGHNPDNRHAAYAILAFIYIYYFFYDIAYSPLLVAYTVEITPFKIRAKVLMLMNLFVSCSLVFNQYVNPIALDAIGWKYYIVYLGWLAFEVVYVFLFVIETKNRTLEETSLLFDGDDAVEEVMDLNHGSTAVGGVGHAFGSEEKSEEIEHYEKV